MNQDKWTEQLRNKLADHQETPPEGLWERIEAATPYSSRRGSGRTRLITLRRWAVAASTAALVAVGGWWWSGENIEPLSNCETESGIVNPLQQTETTFQQKNVNSLQQTETTFQQKNVKPLQQKPVIAEVLTPNIQKEQTASQTTIPEEDGNGGGDYGSLQTEKGQQETTKQTRKEHQTDFAGQQPSTNAVGQQKRHSLTLGLYANNGFGTENNVSGVLMGNAMANGFSNAYESGIANPIAARRQEPIFLAGYEVLQSHRQPVSFGLTVGYQLTPHLILHTGIVYTRLSSTFSYIMRGQQVVKDQTLHYVGLPLEASYTLWSSGALKAYATAGLQADWNIKATLVAEGVEQQMSKDRMQWSAGASLGLQYDILPFLGVYAEPGVKHYFDNGSQVQNFFKDKPTNFSLQVGARLNLGGLRPNEK